jgi:hypothetical protein
MKHGTIAVLLLLLLGITQAQETASWTIMHYMAMDNDLERAAFNDYYEMELAGSTDGVNIVTQFDRAEGYETRWGDWTDTRRFLIEQREPLPIPNAAEKRQIVEDYIVAQGYSTEGIDDYIDILYENLNLGVDFRQDPLEVMGEVDMGDPQVLYDFIMWAATNFPAERYMVVISSHGAGWRGIGPDYGNDNSNLDLPEISEALGAAREALGIDKFDIVGFDACLMAVTDVALMLEPHAHYVLSSQEVIPGNGWEYTDSINAMKANPDWDTFQVGATFVDNYMAYYGGPGKRTKVGLSLIETAALPDLLMALEDFTAVVGADTVELFSALGSARNNSQTFGTSLGDRAEAYSFIDLRDFMTLFSIQTTITEDAFFAAQAVIAAYDRAVVYSLADARLPRATGLAIYLPPTPPVYEAFGGDYPLMAPESFAFWQDYLFQFYSTILSELDGSALQLEISRVQTLGEVGSVLDTPTVFFEAAGKGVIDLSYTVTYIADDGTRFIVDSFPISYTTTLPTGETVIEYPNELTPSTFSWGADIPYVSDGTNSVVGLINASAASGTEGTIQGTYISAEGSQPAFLVVDISDLSIQGVLALAEDAPYEVKPLPGDVFIVDLISISAEGDVSIIPLTDSPLTFGVEPFRISYQPAPSGTYELGLSMGDLGGNSIYRSVAFTVNNDEVTGRLRGYTDVNKGIYFQYPFAWGQSSSITNEEGLVTEVLSDNAGEAAIFVTAYADTDALAALGLELEALEASGAEISEAALGGLQGYFSAHTLELEDGTARTVYLFSVVHEAAQSVIVFSVQAQEPDDALALLELVDGSLQLFEPQE